MRRYGHYDRTEPSPCLSALGKEQVCTDPFVVFEIDDAMFDEIAARLYVVQREVFGRIGSGANAFPRQPIFGLVPCAVARGSFS